MINLLATPSVCVIDDEPSEYQHILSALNQLHIGCIHIKGDTTEGLPDRPFDGLRLVFTDLYLSSATTGKNMASHTANVFQRIVSPESAPLVVVIWSKHIEEKASEGIDADKTESDLFVEAIYEANSAYKGRLIIVKMPKPTSTDKGEWMQGLKDQLNDALNGMSGTHALWVWESLVRRATVQVGAILTSAINSIGDSGRGGEIDKGLRSTLRKLILAQSGEMKVLPNADPRHLYVALTQLLSDKMENSQAHSSLDIEPLLRVEGDDTAISEAEKNQINGAFLSSEAYAGIPYPHGTIYRLEKYEVFEGLFGADSLKFLSDMYKKGNPFDNQEWLKNVEIILVEISPACDIAQGKRRNAILMAGLLMRGEHHKKLEKSASICSLPKFQLRWGSNSELPEDIVLGFCSLYKSTVNASKEHPSLTPWFRLREAPTSHLRNWYSSHSSRIGFVSL